jgi:histidinol dehydrogenase
LFNILRARAVAVSRIGRAKITIDAVHHRREFSAKSIIIVAVVNPSITEPASPIKIFANGKLKTRNPSKVFDRIQNAGAVFLGPHTPEAIGDYLAGPNHILPTAGTARFLSPLSVEDFTKRTNLISFTFGALKRFDKDVKRFAGWEGLEAFDTYMHGTGTTSLLGARYDLKTGYYWFMVYPVRESPHL